jgi:hypothetical protein
LGLLLCAAVYLDYPHLLQDLPAVRDGLIIALLASLVLTIIAELIVHKETKGLEQRISVALDAAPAAITQRILEEFATNQNLSLLMTQALKSKVGDTGTLSNLYDSIALLLQDRYWLTNLRATVSATKVLGSDRYELEVREEFTWPDVAPQLLIALTSDRETLARIGNYSKEVDIAYFCEPDSVPQRAGQLESVIQVQVSGVSGGQLVQRHCAFEIVSTQDRDEALKDLGLSPAQAHRVVLARFLFSGASPGDLVNIVYCNKERLSAGYCFYSLDRMCFLQELSFDLRSLREHVMNPGYLEFMFCPTLKAEVSENGYVIRFQPRSWLPPGSGAMVRWRT